MKKYGMKITTLALIAAAMLGACTASPVQDEVPDNERCYEACRHIESLCALNDDDLRLCNSRCNDTMAPLTDSEKYAFMRCITVSIVCDTTEGCFDAVPDGDDESDESLLEGEEELVEDAETAADAELNSEEDAGETA